MTTKQEIPSESRQQVVNKLKELKGNIIVTGSTVGIPETYLNEYKRESSDKIITIVKMQEIITQIKKDYQAKFQKRHAIDIGESILKELDISFYVESLLALDLCTQLRKRKLDLCKNLTSTEKIEILRNLRNFQLRMIKKQHNFLLGMNQDYLKKYEKYAYLEPLIKELGENYDWEWIIFNFDNPIEDAETLQNVMLQYVQPICPIGPKRILLSAYDENLKELSRKTNFQILHIPREMSYQEMRYCAIKILHNDYPRLEKQAKVIEHVLNSPALQQLYRQKDFPVNDFIKGITKFYGMYSCIYHHEIGYILSEIECLSTIYEYITHQKNEILEEQKKKSKLYI